MERYQAVRSPEIVLPAPGPIARHFRGRAPNVAATSAVLLKAARALGPVTEEAKKTSFAPSEVDADVRQWLAAA